MTTIEPDRAIDQIAGAQRLEGKLGRKRIHAESMMLVL
jgi:hypothetical protein